jgi:hypothetical protein
MWISVVDIANLLQTDDLFQIAGEKVSTEWINSSEALEQLINLPCKHQCSPLGDPKYFGVDGKWAPATKSEKETGGKALEEKSNPALNTKPLPAPKPVDSKPDQLLK